MSYKKMMIFLYAIIGFFVMSVSIHLGFTYLVDMNKWSGLIIGVLFMLVSAVIYFQADNIPLLYILSFILNMIGVGLSITAYYIFKAYALNLEDYLTAILNGLGLILLFSILTYVKSIKRHIKVILSLVVLAFFIGSLILWLRVDTFTGLSFYFLNVSYFYLIAIMSKNESSVDLMKEMSIVSFGAFFTISFIVLVIISEGEALEGVGEGIGNLFVPEGKKKRR